MVALNERGSNVIMQSTHSRHDLDKVRGGYRAPPSANRLSPKGYWKGIPPGELAAIMSHLMTVRRKWQVAEKFALSQDESNMVGAYTVKLPTWLPPPGCDYFVGVSNSNALRKALTLYGGITLPTGGVMVTSARNLGKHTKGKDYAGLLSQGIQTVRNYDWQHLPDVYHELLTTPMPLALAESLLVQAGREGHMPWSRVGQVDALYRDGPSNAGTGTAWDLVRAFARVAVKNPPLNQLDQMYGFWCLLKPHVRLTRHNDPDTTTGE